MEEIWTKVLQCPSRAIAVALILAVAWQGCLQRLDAAVPQAAEEVQGEAQQKQPEVAPTSAQSQPRPAQVDPKLLNKRVAVHCRDGRVYNGRLLEISENSLSIDTVTGIVKIPTGEVTRVERARGRKAILAVLVVAVGIGIATLIANAAID